MGKLLDEIFEELKEREEIEQLRIVCDQIKNEEILDKNYDGPSGPNIFLSLPAYEDKNYEYFLSLERTTADSFSNVLYKRKHKIGATLLRVQDIKNNETIPKKLIQEYGRNLKFYRKMK